MFRRIFLGMVCLGLGSLPAFAAEEMVAKIYEIGKVSGEPLFTQKSKVTENADGSRRAVSTITDAAGQVMMTEEAELRGAEILAQKMEQRQIEEAYELAVEGDKIVFRTFSLKNGERKLSDENKEKRPENFLTGPAAPAFVASRWEELLAGKEVSMKFGIFEVAKTIGFDLEKRDGAPGELLLRMTPSSFLINMFVSPIYMTFDLATKRMVHFKGRTPLRKKVGEKWKPFDAEITYEYKKVP